MNNFRKKLISACIKDFEIAEKSKRAEIDPDEYFSKNIDKKVYEVVLEILEKEDDIGPELVKKGIELDKTIEDEKRGQYKSYIDSLQKIDTTGANFSLEKIVEQKNKLKVLKTSKYIAHALEEGKDVEQITENVTEYIRDISENEKEYEISNYLTQEHFQERQMQRMEINSGVDGVEMIDNLSPFEKNFPRGLQSKTMTGIAGPTGSGKSVLATNFVRGAAHPDNGKNVLYVMAENKKIQAESRLDSIILDQKYSKIHSVDLEKNESESFFKGAKENGWGHIITAKVVPHEFTADTLVNIKEEVEKENDINIEVIVLDSMDHQQPIESADRYWVRKSSVVWDNKYLTDKEDIVFICTYQGRRSSAEKDSRVTNEDSAGSYQIPQTLDNVIFFNTKENDKMLNRGCIRVTKARDSGVFDEENKYFYFDDSERLIPWDDYFDDQVDPTGNADDVIKELKRHSADTHKSEAGFNIQE